MTVAPPSEPVAGPSAAPSGQSPRRPGRVRRLLPLRGSAVVATIGVNGYLVVAVFS